jgi:hypothetical protein
MSYTITKEGSLLGDEVLSELASGHFHVRLFEYADECNAGIEDVTGQGRVPDPILMWQFAERQVGYTKELKLRQPLLKARRKRGKK